MDTPTQLTVRQRRAVSAAMSILGKISTPRKAAAAKRNGKKGGRPKKRKPDKKLDKPTAGL